MADMVKADMAAGMPAGMVATPVLTSRRHVDLLRVTSASCPGS